MPPQIITNIRRELENRTDPAGQAQAQRFFKEAIKVYGLKAGEVRKIGKKYFSQIQAFNQAGNLRPVRTPVAVRLQRRNDHCL